VHYKINIKIDPAFAGQVEPRLLRAAARAALDHQAASTPSELTIAVTNAAALRVLNRTHLQRDHATDVLSFPSDEIDADTGRRYLGDIAIAYPRAVAQAKAAAHPVQAELQLLVVHGVLHLLGHDHARPGERARMWRSQAEVLRRLKVPFTVPDRP
jgi:probable rRNA maturation factor